MRTQAIDIITVFWRPGCLFCSHLFRELDARSVPYMARNIWDDLAAAAVVRLAADGNETVPTVQVGDQFLVNYTADFVLTTAHQVDPDTCLPEPRKSSWGNAWMVRRRTGGRS